MKLLKLTQGTKEWKIAREKHFTASDAPALMGASKYKTRKQLLDEKSGAPTEVITPAKQKLFDKGHKAEDDARNVLAVEEMDEYLPCVGVLSVPPFEHGSDDLPLMASFDGRSDNEDHLFEHKLWNETLAENVRNKTIEASHYWQLEHQLLVSGGDYVLFVVSDGTANKREMMEYYPVEGRAEELIIAWSLFQSDLQGHKIEAKQELVVADKRSFPAIQCSVTGSQITTNIASCLDAVRKLAKIEMSRSFETDQDFADKDQLNKDVKKARAELKSRVAEIKGEFVSYSEFESVALDMDKVLQQMQSAGEKQVKQAKEDKKTFLKNEAHSSLMTYITECNATIKAPFSIEQVVTIAPDWLSAMKNKRTIKSIEDALDTELNSWKVKLTTATEVIAPNFKFLEKNANDYKFLFQDVFTLIDQPEESFKAIVTTRINEHKEIEAKNLAEEAARIEKKAKEKAEAEATKKLEAEKEAIRQQERDRVNAENKAISEHVEAILINAQLDDFKAKESINHPDNCKGCPDCQGINCKITDQAFKEEFDNLPISPLDNALETFIKQPHSQLEKNINAIETVRYNEISQLQKRTNNLESQKAHVPPHVDFLNWSRDYSIDSNAFLALEILITKHLTK